MEPQTFVADLLVWVCPCVDPLRLVWCTEEPVVPVGRYVPHPLIAGAARRHTLVLCQMAPADPAVLPPAVPAVLFGSCYSPD